jgi:serine phosphatase RsbU (regulator of sigma subunit)
MQTSTVGSRTSSAVKASPGTIHPLDASDAAPPRRRVILPVRGPQCDTCVSLVDEAMQEMQGAVAHEHRMVRSLQDALLPRVPSRILDLDIAVRYKAASDDAAIGSNFYDVFRLEGTTAAIVVGDVGGEGLNVAVQIAIIRYMLRYALYTRVSLANAVSELNALIADHRLLGPFTTLFVGIYDSDLRELSYVSCGLEPALLVMAGEKPRAEVLQPTGPAIGASTSSEFSERSAMLLPGDAVAVFTDGFLAPGKEAHGEMLAISSLVHVLHGKNKFQDAEDLADCLTTGARTHAGGAFKDDACLLIARVDGAA